MTHFNFSENIVKVNGIDLHFIEYKNAEPPLLLMHGLTANAHAFDGLVKAGLAENFSLISVDFRGRGLSSKQELRYGIEEHAQDIMGLLDLLKIDAIMLCGHSFGGLMATYLAFHFPERFTKVIILDAAPKMNPKAAEMLGSALSRLDKTCIHFENYLSTIRSAPYCTFWDDAMLSYYQADVKVNSDNSVQPRSNLKDIVEVAIAISKEPWARYFENISQNVLLVNATDAYTMGMPLLPEALAIETHATMKNATYVSMKGNHQTMLYGEHALVLVEMIKRFAL